MSGLRKRLRLGDTEIVYELRLLGDDIVALVSGRGAHIGCAVLAVPRESLSGTGAPSATASVLNVTGHKDELLLRGLAERLSALSGCRAAAIGGVHFEGLSAEQLAAVEEINRQALRLAEDWVQELRMQQERKKGMPTCE